MAMQKPYYNNQLDISVHIVVNTSEKAIFMLFAFIIFDLMHSPNILPVTEKMVSILLR